MAENQNYTIVEGYTLPSKGLIYETKVKPEVELRSMTARDEMRRLSPSSTPLKTIADIIENCMIQKPAIPVYDMAVGDYEYLLHKLRIVTYGPDYKLSLVCPHCGETVDTSYSLENLIVKDFDQKAFEELRTFTLPKSGQVISLKIQTPHSMEIVENTAKEMKRKMKGASLDFDTYALLNYIIDTVDGAKLPAYELENFIDRLPAMDMNRIINNSNKMTNAIGLDTRFDVECTKCGGAIPTFFRFGTEFFRPTED